MAAKHERMQKGTKTAYPRPDRRERIRQAQTEEDFAQILLDDPDSAGEVYEEIERRYGPQSE